MTSPSDIITYIGVPLAVLGVLPIIWNTISTLLSLASIRRTLRRARLNAIARGDVINHIIEVELPRYTIAPLHREEQCKDYWRLCDHPSQIPGGTWTIFNWRMNAIGLKTQRIGYPDQLRQPQAEISFEELVSFLLDLGAVLDTNGFRNLRNSGLWAPLGTPLLLSQDQQHAVLSIAPLDDSDGNLSLSVRWSSGWGTRDLGSLPPYWVMLNGPALAAPEGTTEEKTTDSINGKHKESSITARKYTPKADKSPSIRCQVGVRCLTAAIDDYEPQLFEHLDIRHLEVNQTSLNTAGTWFASVLTALGTSSNTILWNYKIPDSILSFAKKDTLPCGILVLLDIIPESSTPEWATQYPHDQAEEREFQFRQMREQDRAMKTENTLPPEQKQAAIRDRQSRSHHDWVERINLKRRRDADRSELRVTEALQSPKWDNKLVAEHNLAWLKKEGYVDPEHDLKRATEVLLWRMITEVDLTKQVVQVLDLWKAAVDNGGLRKAEFQDLKRQQVDFAWATLMLAMIEDSAAAVQGSLARDLQECFRIWKKVRLG